MVRHDTIYHLVENGPWIHDAPYAPASLEREGFIHLSTREQVLGTVKRFFHHTHNLILIEVAAARLQAEIRYEEADGQRFPHLYGPLNPEAVVAVHMMARDENGNYQLPVSL